MARGSLDDYHRKRNFDRTPEPRGRVLRSRQEPRFVVHRHDARNLHYDLRLALGGVLRSWAIPKGFSYDRSLKRFAARTEDHPAEYADFEGEIPRGEYGAGTLTLWDSGRFRLLNPDGEDGIENGKLEFVLEGRRLRGEWHLFTTSSGEWLMIKARDRFASEDGDRPFAGDLEAARPGGPLQRWRFMEPADEGEAFDDPDWLFEARLDGRRAALWVDGDREPRLLARGGAIEATLVSDIIRATARLRADRCLLDGVLVAPDDRGRPDAERLERRLDGADSGPLCFYAFDLPLYEEWDLRDVPLRERKARLASLLPDEGAILFLDHLSARGTELAQAVARNGLRGLIAKRAASGYRRTRSKEWQRIRIPNAEAIADSSPASEPNPQSKARFTNLDKVYWPESGETKGDLLAYYDQVAHALLPHLRDRAIHLFRHPHGIDGEAFFQREAPEHLVDAIPTALLPSSSKERKTRHLLCQERAHLLALVNLGSIDLHPWLSRHQTPDAPDWCVIDLDPKGAPFSQVVKVARTTGKILRALDIRFAIKTSGKSGLHLHVPLAPGHDYDQSRLFGETIAALVVRELGDLATVERQVSARKGRVYVDVLQNRRGQTVVPPYVVRPVPGATVSTPIHWDELDAELDPRAFDLHGVPERVERLGDLFRPALDEGQSLARAIVALEDFLGTK